MEAHLVARLVACQHPTMESVSCNVIYVDRCVAQDRSVKAADWAWEKDPSRWESTHLAENVGLLLQVFDEGMPYRESIFAHSRFFGMKHTNMSVQFIFAAPGALA